MFHASIFDLKDWFMGPNSVHPPKTAFIDSFSFQRSSNVLIGFPFDNIIYLLGVCSILEEAE